MNVELIEENILKRLENTINEEIRRYNNLNKHTIDIAAAEISRKFRVNKKDSKKILLKEMKVNIY